MSFADRLLAEPWAHDLLATLRRVERSYTDLPRIGDSASRYEDCVTLGQDPYLAFPASTIAAAERDAGQTLRLRVQFLGLLGPQGALPLAVTDETYGWRLEHDEALPRFLDVINNRFLQLFFRAWADARPIAQHENPEADRFEGYAGAAVGLGSPAFRGLDSIPDSGKIAFAGLLGPAARSGSRLRNAIAGLFGITAEVEEFVGTFLEFEPGDRSRLGRANAGLGRDLLLGRSVFSIEDRVSLCIFAADLADYQSLLPGGGRCRQLTDFMLFYLGDEFEWGVELALPVAAVEPVRLGACGRLGYTTWIGSGSDASGSPYRRDARFHPAERAGRADYRAGRAS